MSRFRVLQFNMQFGQMWDDTYPDRAPVRIESTLAEIKRHNADIVLLQEVEHGRPGGEQLQPPPNYTRLRAGLEGYDSWFSYPKADPRELPFGIALARVNEVACAASPPAPRAVWDDGGSLVRALDGAPSCAALLAAVARDAVELLTDPVARACIRQCEGDNCPIVYLDTSRGRRRRWCSSETGGNRVWVARHRRRAALARACGVLRQSCPCPAV